MAGSDDAPSATEAARRAKLERLRGKRRSSKSKAGDQASSSSPPASAPTSPDDLGGFPSFDAAAPPAEASAPTMRGVAEAPPDFGSDAKALEDRWGTAAYLLRNPKLPDAAALARTALAARDRRGNRARDGAEYVNQLKVLAKRMNVRTGKLSQMLLPYGEETSTLEQAHASNAKLGLPADAAARLAALAADTRKLVRCKIADDNDIEQMLECCRELTGFFDALDAFAAAKRVPAFAVFRQFDAGLRLDGCGYVRRLRAFLTKIDGLLPPAVSYANCVVYVNNKKPERVAAAVLEAYARLRVKDGGCWTVVAGVAAVAGDDVEVLSVASGCKCVGGPASPALVRDGHAEVLA
ncbi:hypothetical protein AURANDRAFT_68786, partial [Aureococcus anophagefferens]